MRLFSLLLFVFSIFAVFSSDVHAGVIINRPIYFSLNRGLIGYWTLDGNDIQGSTVKDASGHGNTGTIGGDPQRVVGQRGQALNFDGNNEDIEIDGASSQFNGNAGTMSAWVKFNKDDANDQTDSGVVSIGFASGNNGNVSLMKRAAGVADNFELLYRQGGQIIYEAQTTLGQFSNQWRHVAGVWDNTRIYLYVDGALMDSTTRGATLTGTLNDAHIGKTADGSSFTSDYFEGLIDEVRIYNRVLSSAEVMRLYRMGNASAAPRSAKKSSPITVTKLDSGTNTTDAASYNTNSITPSANSLLLLATYQHVGSGAITDPTSVTGNGLTWVKIDGLQMTGGNLKSISLWRAMGANPSAGAITVNYDQTLQNFMWIVSEFKNVDISGTNGSGAVVQSTDNNVSDSSITATLNSFGQDLNRPFAIVGLRNNVAISPEAGWTELDEVVNAANGLEMNMQWNATSQDTTPSASWSGTQGSAIIALELKAGKTQSTVINASQKLKVKGDLVGYWTFDGPDLSGTTAIGQSGNGNNGTLTSGPRPVTGVAGQALSFDGVDDLVNAASPATLDNLGPMTVSAWIKPVDEGEASGGAVVFKGTATDGNGFWRFALTPTNAIQFVKDYATTDLALTTSNNTILRGEWQHVLMTWDGSSAAANAHIYINDVEASYQTTTNGVDAKNSDAALNLFIGNDSAAGVTFNGAIDEVRIYNRVLTDAEIKRLYRLGR